MSGPNLSSKNLQQPIQKVASHPWVEKLARLGYATKGVIYLIIGLLALQAALGVGGKTTDSEGAIQTIFTQPFGKFLLIIVIVGLIGYALERTVQTFLPQRYTRTNQGLKQIARRIGYAISALSYGALAATAIKIILGSSGGSDRSTQDWTARLLSQPFGQWLVGLIAAGIIAVGCYQLYRAYQGKFRRHLQLSTLRSSQRKWVITISKVGIAARGVVFAIIGAFLLQAALTFEPSRARGLGEALAALAEQAGGNWILGLVALGLIAYSIYSFIEAKYRSWRR